LIIFCSFLFLADLICLNLFQESEDGNMEKIQRWPEVLFAKAQVCRLPVRNRPVSVLFMPLGMGPMEPEAGGICCIRVRAGHNCGWNPVALPHCCPVVGDIPNRGRKGRGQSRNSTRSRGSYQFVSHSEKLVGPRR
jgi:hypothetical protein